MFTGIGLGIGMIPATVGAADLSAHYGTGPGRIAIHFDTDHATRDGSGNVTALQNRGGAGAVFDAAVSGAAIPVSGKALAMTAVGGVPILANAASLDQVRFMWVCSTESVATNMRFFGSETDELRAGAIQVGPPPNVYMTIFSTRSGSPVGPSLTPRWNVPPSGRHLFEIDMDLTTARATMYLDGVAVGSSAAITHAAFTVDRIGVGAGVATNPFVGAMGDVLGVTLGAGDTATIAAARAYLAARHGVVLA